MPYEYTVCEECATELQWLKQVGCVGDELIKNFEGAPSSPLPSFPLLSYSYHCFAQLVASALCARASCTSTCVLRLGLYFWNTLYAVMWCTVVCTTVHSVIPPCIWNE